MDLLPAPGMMEYLNIGFWEFGRGVLLAKIHQKKIKKLDLILLKGVGYGSDHERSYR